ncbi:MAG: methyltransferase regulatory domain-containing protein [Selenomonadaceae bacterium]|nr:methyltransferase regulatory domain-containing protein [Selenomonadaceae bacterium]
MNIHAAATQGKYFGTDFNPAHVAHANKLREGSGANAKFFDNSFEEFLNRDDLPQFDSISLHGIWSWVSAENQTHIKDFAKKFLKAGGIFYNSYNCYPGWAPAAPMRELFILYDKYAHKSNKTFNRVEETLKFTEEVLNKNPAYFRRVPDIKNIFENAKKHNHDYLAHEYFNRDWICMYFSEVAEILEDAKLNFACTTEILESFPQFHLPQDVSEFLNKFESPIMREQLKDYFVSRQFRKDIYIRGSRKISDFERFKKLIGTNYILMTQKNLPKEIVLPQGKLNVPADLPEKVFEYLSADNFKAKTFEEFVKKNPQIPPIVIIQALILWIQGGNIMPCQSEETVQSVKKNCLALNKFICKRAEISDEVGFLASPVLGGGYPVNRFDRIFLSAMFDGNKTIDDIANFSWKITLSQGQRLIRENKIVESAEENISMFKNMVKDFWDNRLPIIKSLQMI